ncbi:Clavaminate synthase-like protein [Calocera viscosa TUFC12733]|uniref:Clavaminate synthase-like protein n=1 Tax=Calocera viscosa (strain TUFC12733) TaxID=1330018 RepID=A0A167Q714_CALVF|nr:Clavaminate synthase-like protein [Calocera viscosa TUFC12733]
MEENEWAELATVDLSDINTVDGKQRQAKVLIDALRIKGFFYVKNFNISQDRLSRQFAMGNAFCDLPLEDKLQYIPELGSGEYNGYLPVGRAEADDAFGLTGRVEVFNMPKLSRIFNQAHPRLVKDHVVEVEEFVRSLHSEVLDHLVTLLAIAVELPENYFIDMHKYNQNSENHLHYLTYGKYTSRENKQLEALGSRRLWDGGHIGIGSFTLLFGQPVATLQIKDHTDGKWRWVKPQDAALTVKACHALSLLTGGYIKSTFHRITVPPRDQPHVDHLGLLYFTRPKNIVELATIKESPVLNRAGFTKNELEAGGFKVPTMGQWAYAVQEINLECAARIDHVEQIIATQEQLFLTRTRQLLDESQQRHTQRLYELSHFLHHHPAQ